MIKNYTNDYGEELPGKGIISYHKDYDEVVFIGFESTLQKNKDYKKTSPPYKILLRIYENYER